MPAIPYWFALASAVVLPLFAFLLSPPTKWANRVIELFAIHPKLSNPDITSLNVYGVELTGRDRDRFIIAFNNAEFLFEYGSIAALNKDPIVIRVKQKKKVYEFKAYLYGEGMIELIRFKRKKQIPYRVTSDVLEAVLEMRMKDQWWIQNS